MDLSRIIDGAIAVFNPQAAARRAGARSMLSQIRSYEGASKGRRTKSWKAGETSANTEAIFSLQTLRDRSRDLVRNNPYAKRAVESWTTNTIGSGIHPTPAQVGKSNALAKRYREAWRAWAQSTKCDANGQMNFAGLERVAMRALVESGEVLIRKVKRNNGSLIAPLALQILEPDYLDHNKTMATENGGQIIQGVEFDKDGKRVAYWLFDRHPGDMFGFVSFIPKRVPVEEIIHLYKVDRPGQVRGIPLGVSAFIRMRDLDQYADAQLLRQQIAACFTVFIQDSAGSETFTGQQKPYEGISRVEPGIIEVLPPGKTVQFATPPNAAGYSDYTKSVAHEISIAYGVPYSQLTGDLSQVNFSSGRMGWIDFARLVEEMQELVLIPMFLDPVWDWFVEAAMVAGLANKPILASWTSPRREMIDPLKEIRALSEQVRNGFIPWSEAVRQGGYDPDEVLAALKEDNARFDELGLMLVCDPRNDPARADQFVVPNEQMAPDTGKSLPSAKKSGN